MLAEGFEALAAEPQQLFAFCLCYAGLRPSNEFVQRVPAEQAVVASAMGSNAVGGAHPARHAPVDIYANMLVGGG